MPDDTDELPAVTADTDELPRVDEDTEVLPPVPAGAGVPATPPEEESAVFADHSGGRRRLAKRIGIALAALTAGFLSTLIVGLLGGPAAPYLPLPGDKPDSARSTPATIPSPSAPRTQTSGPTPETTGPASPSPTSAPTSQAPTTSSPPSSSSPTSSNPTATTTSPTATTSSPGQSATGESGSAAPSPAGAGTAAEPPAVSTE